MTAVIRPRRSLLFVPASNVRALEKARSLRFDAVIIDLEDAVAPSSKVLAREQAKAALAHGFNGREVALRLNGIDTPWGEDDLAFAASIVPDAVVIPKVSSADDVREVNRRLDSLGAPKQIRIWSMIETARAVLDADAIARAALEPASRLSLFMLGTNDLARETSVRIKPGRASLLPWLQQTLLAARASGLGVIDAVYNDFNDVAGFADECTQGRDLGFDGKSLIHPAQIAAANAIFGPDEEEIAHAHALIAAFSAPENAGKGAVTFNGRMIEELHVDIAQRQLALARAIKSLHCL